MDAMVRCPVCNELLSPNDLAPGRQARCSWCGNRLASWQSAGSTTVPAPAGIAPEPAPLPPLQADTAPATTPVTKVTNEVFDDEYEPDPSDSLVTQLRHLDIG